MDSRLIHVSWILGFIFALDLFKTVNFDTRFVAAETSLALREHIKRFLLALPARFLLRSARC